MPTTKAKWEKDIAVTRVRLPGTPNSHGQRIACLNGCGNYVSVNVKVCRDCRRKAKLKKAREACKIRRKSKKE